MSAVLATATGVTASCATAERGRGWTENRKKDAAWRAAYRRAVSDLVRSGKKVPVPGPPHRRPGQDEVTFQRRMKRWKMRAQAAGLQWPEAIAACGSVWAVKACPDCGHVELKSARRVASCGRRFCPICARRRGNLKAAKLKPKAAEIVKESRQNIYLATFTARRDLNDPATYEPLVVRKRAEAIANGVVAVRAFVGRADRGMGMHVAPDVGVQGGYHMHGLIASSRFDWAGAQAVYRKALARRGMDGNIDFKLVYRAGSSVADKVIAQAVAEVTKYPGKCPANWRKVEVHEAEVDPETGEVLVDEQVGVVGGEGAAIDPELAAIHEVALYAMSLNRWYGSFRNLQVPEEGVDLNSDEAMGSDGVDADEHPRGCRKCGSELPPQLVRYGVHDYETSRCVVGTGDEDRLDRAQLAAARFEALAERWGVSPEHIECWREEAKRRVHGAPWIVIANPVREDFAAWEGVRLLEDEERN